MSFDDCAQKFRQCAAFAAAPLPLAVIESVIETVRHLESVADISELLALLA